MRFLFLASRLRLFINRVGSEPKSNEIEVGGEYRSAAEDPHRESKPSAHAPAPHARHDRSMARSSFVARMIFEEMCYVAARRVQHPSDPALIVSDPYEAFPYQTLRTRNF